jgi:acetyl-CoA carboxylase carboxyltransferase component
MTDPAALTIRAGVGASMDARVETLAERRVVVCRSLVSLRSGALGRAAGETLAAAADLACRERLPLVVHLASSGADVTEGIDSLHGWGTAARALVRCSGIVPLLMSVEGPAVAGPSLLLGLMDIVVMTADAYAFVSGPHMVRQFTGVPVSNQRLGGAGAHARFSGVPSAVVADAEEAEAFLSDVLRHLPSSNDDEPPRWPRDDPADRPVPEAAALIPDAAMGSYDVRDVITRLVDHGEHLELRPHWAANLVTTLAVIDGRPVGVVANQPVTMAGTLDIPASQKGAGFVAFCDAFNVPLVTLIDTSGFYPGKDLEWRGMIRHGAQLAFAYCRATVPRVSVTLRKSYGGAYIVMDSKRIGNDIALAWPSAEIAVMGAKGAAEILHRRADSEERARVEAEYEERMLNPYVSAERGLVDAVIDPADTRAEVAAALDLLSTKRERIVQRPHDNTPL